jgi:hypothetical protein
MQSKDLHQMKAAIRDQAFLGNARVFCIMGPVVAARRRFGQLLAMIRGWGRWYPVERVRIEYAGRQLLSSRSWPDERAFATTPVRSWGKFRLLKERYSPSQPIYGRTGRIDRKLPRVCRDRDPLCTRPIGQRSASFSARTHKIIGPPPDTLAETRPELARCEDLVTE